MQIGHVTSSISRRGAGVAKIVRDLASVQARDHQVQVFTLLDEHTGDDQPQEHNISVFAAPTTVFRHFGFSASLFDTIRQQTPRLDIMHLHGLWMYPNWASGTIARREAIPYIISPHGMLDPSSLARNPWNKRLARFFIEDKNLRHVSCLHACSEQEAENFRSFGYNGPIAVIKPGISPADLALAADLPLSHPAERHPHLQGKKLLLYHSRLHPQKGPHLLLEAWKQICTDHPDWHLVMSGYGEPSTLAELVVQARRGPLFESVTFTGPSFGTDKWDLLKAADLFVLPSYSENFCLAIVEALLAGTPVITTKGTPWSELVTRGCGWWIDTGIEPLAQAIHEALQLPPAELNARGERGREFVTSELDRELMGSRMDSLYQWVLHGGTPPDCMRD